MRLKALVGVAAILLTPLSAAFASSFSQLVVFGDSLSDTGNAYIASGGTYPGANYGLYHFAGTNLTTGIFSDGSNTTPTAAATPGLWVDKLSAKLGVADPMPALALTGGTDYAVAGATTGTGAQNMGTQLAYFAASNSTGASSTALYALWGGANDIIDGDSPTQAADNIAGYIKELSAIGAKNFVWLNLPLIGDTPEFAAGKAQLNAATMAFNSEWSTDLAALQGAGLNVTGVNIAGLFSSIIGDPGRSGFTNVTSPAQTSGLSTDAGYLFWDGLHPTAAGHAQIADTVYNTLVPTPEPASIGFAFLGFVTLAGFGYKSRRGRAS